MKACIILHNMIIDDERIDDPQPIGDNNSFAIAPPANPNEHEVNLYRAALLQHVTDARIHDQLQFDLAEHHWNFVDDYDDDGNVD